MRVLSLFSGPVKSCACGVAARNKGPHGSRSSSQDRALGTWARGFPSFEQDRVVAVVLCPGVAVAGDHESNGEAPARHTIARSIIRDDARGIMRVATEPKARAWPDCIEGLAALVAVSRRPY